MNKEPLRRLKIIREGKEKEIKAEPIIDTNDWIVSTDEIDIREGDAVILPSGKKGKATKIFQMNHDYTKPIRIKFTFEPQARESKRK